MCQECSAATPKWLHSGFLWSFAFLLYLHLHIFQNMSSEFLLEKCYANIWTGACKLLPVLCSPTGEYFEMGQGFHCEPMITFQTVWGSGGARKCMWGLLPSSGSVVWVGCRWMVHQRACSSIIHTCKRALCSLTLHRVFKVSSDRKIQWNGRMCFCTFFILLLSALFCLFVSVVLSTQFSVLSFDCFSSLWQ